MVIDPLWGEGKSFVLAVRQTRGEGMKYLLAVTLLLILGCGSNYDSIEAEKLLKSTRALIGVAEAQQKRLESTSQDTIGIYSPAEKAAAHIAIPSCKRLIEELHDCQEDIERAIASRDQEAIERRRTDFMALSAKLKEQIGNPKPYVSGSGA